MIFFDLSISVLLNLIPELTSAGLIQIFAFIPLCNPTPSNSIGSFTSSFTFSVWFMVLTAVNSFSLITSSFSLLLIRFSNHLKEGLNSITIEINPEITDIFNFSFEDFKLINYDPYPHIKGDVAV